MDTKKHVTVKIPWNVYGDTHFIIRLAKTLRELVVTTGKPPARIHISKIDEIDLSLVTTEYWGSELGAEVILYGARKALELRNGGKFLGIPVVWDAEESMVE